MEELGSFWTEVQFLSTSTFQKKKKEIILNPNRAFYLLLIRVEGWNTGIIPFYFHFVKRDDTNRT